LADRVAIIDADPGRRLAAASIVEGAGWEAQAVATADELAPGPSVLVALVSAGTADELRATLGVVRARAPEPAVVVVAPAGAALGASEALGLGADDFLAPDAAPAELAARLRARLGAQRTLGELQRRQRGHEMVLELTRALSSALNIRDILRLVVQRVADTTRVDRASIVLGGGDGTGFVIATSDDVELRDLPIQLSDYPEITQVMESGAPLVIDDAAASPIFDLAQVGGPRAFRSLTVCPILFEERAMGVLFLRGRDPGGVPPEDMGLLRAVADATGIALRNAKLLQSMRDQSRRSRFAHFEAERQLKSLRRYAEFFDSSADGIVVIDRHARVLFCNPAACNITGRGPAELRGASFERILSKDGRRTFDDVRAGFGAGLFPSAVDLPIRKGDGTRRVLSVSFSNVLGEGRGILISLRDVTRERALARELTKTKEFLQRVIDSSVDAVVSADMKGQVLLFNPAAERIYGWRRDEVVGELNVRELYPEGGAREIMRLIRSDELGPPGTIEGYETELSGKHGERIPVRLSASLIVHRGQPIGSVGVFKDLRREREIQAHLDSAREQLASQERKALIAEIAGATAHELNQPLTAVIGYASILARRSAEDARLAAAARNIVRESERMAEIVRKIGKLTKYETKPYVGDTKIIDLERSMDTEPPVTGY
jgi:PAS domain S-box-containing protein